VTAQEQQDQGHPEPEGQPQCLHRHLATMFSDPVAAQLGIGAWALGYAGLGLPVFPLKPGTKKPATKHGFLDATTDPEVIAGPDWWGGNKALNVGVAAGAASGLLVIDLDRKTWIKDPSAEFGITLADGAESLQRWLAERGLTLPQVPWVKTPSGGVHLWMRLNGRTVRNRNGVLPGVDISGDGGYVAVWPSGIRMRFPDDPRERRKAHPGDFYYGTYAWHGCPCQAPLAPDDLLDALEELHGTSSNGQGGGGGGNGWDGDRPKLPPVEQLLEHGLPHPHDDNMTALAGSLVARGVPRDEAMAILRKVADITAETYPWTDSNLARKLDSANGKGFGEPVQEGLQTAAAWAQAAGGQGQQSPSTAPVVAAPRPDINCGSGSGPEAIRAVQKALKDGKILYTYAVSGKVVMLQESDTIEVDADRTLPLPASAVPAGAPELMNLLAHHTRTFRVSAGKNGPVQFEYTPQAGFLTAVLSNRLWPGLRQLNGIIGAPVLRPDGTLLQQPGYDPATGLYLANRVRITYVPAAPPADAVSWARDLVLDRVLRDFPWRGPADRANCLAMLVTQVLRHYLRGSPVPFFPVTATDQSSGKTLLATICGVLFGQASITWTGDDEELRKTLTSVMTGQEGVITFDNLPEGTVVRSAVLSKLLTDRTWGDRMLGKNGLGQFINDRLWMATGNNLRIGGDMATRSVVIAIDPQMPHPERRSGFAIADLESWIREPANQRDLLTAVLVLVADWAAAGCPEADVVPVRQFTKWARVCGGLLAHHKVDGFLANQGAVEDMDDDDADWVGFLARCVTVLGTGWVTSERVAGSAADQRWGGSFPTGKGDDPLLSVKSMGKRLAGQEGRYHGTWVLQGWRDPHTKMRLWTVGKWQPSGGAGSGEDPGLQYPPEWTGNQPRGDITKTWNGKPGGEGGAMDYSKGWREGRETGG